MSVKAVGSILTEELQSSNLRIIGYKVHLKKDQYQKFHQCVAL